MKKILVVVVVGILVLMGLGAGIAIGEEAEQETQQSQHNIQMLINEKFEIKTKYSYIRSYPGGGGIFIINMTPKNDFSGYVILKINADTNLNAELDRETLDKESQVAELTIQPNELTDLKTYEIELTATHNRVGSGGINIDYTAQDFACNSGCSGKCSGIEKLIMSVKPLQG